MINNWCYVADAEFAGLDCSMVKIVRRLREALLNDIAIEQPKKRYAKAT